MSTPYSRAPRKQFCQTLTMNVSSCPQLLMVDPKSTCNCHRQNHVSPAPPSFQYSTSYYSIRSYSKDNTIDPNVTNETKVVYITTPPRPAMMT